MAKEVKIILDRSDKAGVYVDGTKIEGVSGYSISEKVGEVPKVILRIEALESIELIRLL